MAAAGFPAVSSLASIASIRCERTPIEREYSSRSLIGPLMGYLDTVREVHPTHTVTVVIPEYTSRRWWHSLLHNTNGLLVKLYLLSRPNLVVTNVRYSLNGDFESATAESRNSSEKLKGVVPLSESGPAE